MKKQWKMLAVVALGLAAAGCGSSVGNACTVDKDCGLGEDAFCITGKSELPGGYCSKACVPGDDKTCPSDATCVREGSSKSVSACYSRCDKNEDCRGGYKCVGGVHGNPNKVCVGLSY
jgi:hypothetical protein